MTNHHRRTELATLVEALEEDAVLDLVRRRIAANDDPMVIIQEAEAGMRLVGKRHEQGQYFIAGLIMAGQIFSEVAELALPLVETPLTTQTSGTILIGTVQGDIHDLGKSIVIMLLRCQGFTIHDLGVDVPAAEFVARAAELRPDIVGISGLLTASYRSMHETITLLRENTKAWDRSLPIIIGGNQLSEQVCQYVGANCWANDAMEGVRLCQGLMTQGEM